MATIAENLSLLQQTKNDIKTAIESKGQDLTNVPFTQYANKITNIGNGSETQVSDEIVYSDVDNGDEISITLSQLQQVKNDIKTAIENKGQDLTDVPFTGYANKIMNIVIEQEPSGTEGLVYTGLDIDGNITTDETAIIAYMIGDNSSTYGNGYTGTETDVVIPATYNDKPVTTIGKYAFRGKTEITSITIPSSVTTIGNYAFAYCSGLTSIEIPEGVTTISQSTFQKCSSLTSIEIPASVTKISMTAFRESGLESVNFKENSQLYYIGGSAFSLCNNLKSFILPAGVTELSSGVFENSNSLTSITVDKNNTAFKDDNGRAILTIDGKILYAYANMSGTSYTIPEGVEKIFSKSFYGYTNLKQVNLPESLIEIQNFAFRASGLEKITIPQNVTTIGNTQFYDCQNLTEMTVLPTTPPTLGTSAISTATTVIYVPYESLEAYQTATNWKGFADIMVGFGEPQATEGLVYSGLDESGAVTTDETAIVAYMIGDNTTTNGNGYTGTDTEVYIPSTYNGKPVTTIGKYAFRNKTELTSINIPESITNINGSAFYAVTGTITFADGTLISSLGNYSFYGCTGTITGLVLGGGITSLGGGVFQNCTGLSSITIPATITTIDFNAFVGCTGLTSISVEEGNPIFKDDNGRAVLSTNGTQLVVYANASGTEYTIPSSVTTLGQNAFRKCDNLISVIIPRTVTTFNQYVFYDCLNLETVYFENGSSLTELPYGTFRNDAKLTSINIPSSVTTIGNYALYGTGFSSINLPTSLTTIGTSAMAKITNLTSITLPNRLPTIGEAAFRGCTSLTSITIPASVTSIAAAAFADCTSLTEMTLEPATPPTLSGTTTIPTATTTIYVPTASLEAYKTATNWSNFATIMVGF